MDVSGNYVNHGAVCIGSDQNWQRVHLLVVALVFGSCPAFPSGVEVGTVTGANHQHAA